MTVSTGKQHGRRKYTVGCVNCELFSWTVCVSLSVLYCLSVLLLTRCMDVELNPGPCDGNCSTFMQAAQENTDIRFSQILHCLHQQSVTLSRQMEESFYRLGQTLMRIEEDVTRLKHETQDDRRDINELLEDRDKAHTRLDRLEKEMEQRETASRQRNLKFLGIFEPTPGDDRADVDELLATLNYFSSSRTWKHDDIEGTHRIGQVHKTSRQHTRPLIVTFSRGDDKVSILRDRHLREEMRKKGIRVAADLTPRQRDQLQHYKEQGKVAYYKNGRLHVENDRREDYTDRHPNQHATRKGDETDQLLEERQQSYAPRQRRLKDYDYFPSDDHRYRQGSNSDQHNTDAGDRNSQRNTQSRRGGMHDLAPSRHPHLPDDARRQHGGSGQHGDQRYSHASVPYNTRDGGEGDRHLQGAASYIPASTEDYDWLYTTEQYCMAHNVPRAFWPSDLTTPVNPPPMLAQENLSVDPAPSTPHDGTSITVPDPAVPQRAAAPPDTATLDTTASAGVHSLQQALPEATAAGEDHPCPADSTAATDQQQRLPEEPTTTVQQSASEDRQQTAEQPVTTTLQQAQVETEDQF